MGAAVTVTIIVVVGLVGLAILIIRNADENPDSGCDIPATDDWWWL